MLVENAFFDDLGTPFGPGRGPIRLARKPARVPAPNANSASSLMRDTRFGVADPFWFAVAATLPVGP
jgi:hypothetical protein